MPIYGVTDRPVKFPCIGQIRKGKPKDSQGRVGPELPWFRVEFDEKETKAAERFVGIYGDKPTAIRIVLPFNEIDRMWDAFLEAYTFNTMIARSDGLNVLYSLDMDTGEVVVRNGLNTVTGKPVPHPADNVAGYTREGKEIYYSPRGRLLVIIPELQRAAYLMAITGSWADCANISQQLGAFHELNDGIIAGIPLILRRRPQMVSVPMADGGKRRVKKHLLAIEADPDWVIAKLSQVKILALPEVRELLPPGDSTVDVPWTELEGYDDELEGGPPPPPEPPPEYIDPVYENEEELPEPSGGDTQDGPPPPEEPGRPYESFALIEAIQAAARIYNQRNKAKAKPSVVTEKMQQLIRHSVELCNVGATEEALEQYRKIVYEVVFGVQSSKDIDDWGMAQAYLKKYMSINKMPDGSGYMFGRYASREMRALIDEYLENQGQLEMEMEDDQEA